MMMNRTSHRVLIASSLVAGSLALGACSGGGADSGDANADVVTVWHYFTDDQQVKLMDEYKSLFEANHEGATVENVYVPYDQLNSKLISAAGAGQGPDVVVFNGADTATLALAGALAPMDEYWDAFADAEEFSAAALHETEGSLYSVQGYVNVLGLWYNADLLAELGLEAPTTMDELEAAMAASVAAGHGGITLSGLPNSQGEWQGFPWLSADGFDYENLDQAALEAGLGRIGTWVEEGWLPQEAVNWDQTVPFQQFAAGDYAFASNGNWQQGTAAADADFTYGVVPLPLGSDGKVYLGGEGEGIGAFSANPDLAWEYLANTYYSAEGQLLAPEIVGSLPTRADASADEVVTSNELLAAFAATIELFGAAYPDPSIPADAVADLQLTVGQAWSSVIGRQTSATDAAANAIKALTGLLG